MATAAKRPPSHAHDPAPEPRGALPAPVAALLAACEAIYRFLASLKLAVISLGTLASVLAYATFFESWYGTAAVQEWIYRSAGFAILLAFLGANILCAALIRYPWKRRQIGFLITHTGLLILLAGSYISVRKADEGQVGMLEGETRDHLVRIDYPVVRVRPLDPKTGEPTSEREMPFRPGTFAWGPGKPRPRSVVGSLLHAASFGAIDTVGAVDVLSQPRDPYRVVVKSYLPASVTSRLHIPDPAGPPMAKIRPRFKGPQMPRAMDVFESGDQRWFKALKPAYRAVKGQGPAEFAFLYVDRPEKVEDFLNPPKDAGKAGVARFRYRDDSGKDRVYDWPLDGQEGKAVTLPDSNLEVTFGDVIQFPTTGSGFGRALGGAETIPIAEFKVRKGPGEPVPHYGWASLPMFPNVIPTQHAEGGKPPAPLVAIDYYLPPALDAASGRFGVVEVLGTPEGKLYYRVFGRGEPGVGALRASGPLKAGEEITAFGGKPGQPMTISFAVEDYLPAGREKDVCEPIVLPKGQMGNGIPAALVEMTVDGHTEEFWVRRSRTLEPLFDRVSFPGGDYEVSLDFDRKPLDFQVKLVDFQVGFDPGTEQASSYVSEVRLTDESAGIKDAPRTIQMNEPMVHRGYTFYQSNYMRDFDQRTERETGRFISVFQVATDPGRPVKYLGCLGVVLGAFVQFYMRAGVFTDGGRRERQRAEAKAARHAQADGDNGTIDVNESGETL